MTDEKLSEDIEKFRSEVRSLINRLGLERMCNVPDYILANYLTSQLSIFAIAKNDNEIRQLGKRK